MTEKYDVVIVGGGIHGVGVAQAAACKGYSVLLIEKVALASGTSSKSSKLIHGGLRYLEGLHFSLVRESLKERQILLNIAPDLVKLRPFNIPVYKNTSRRPLTLRAGLSLYALLGGLGQSCRFKSLGLNDWGNLDDINTENLQQVFQYYDAQTDDAKLTRSVMQSAIDFSAEIVCPANFLKAVETSQGFNIQYEVAGLEKSCEAKVFVNAAGPWANEIDELIEPKPEKVLVDLVQGAHLVVPDNVKAGCYYLEAPQDGRAVFLMPWGENALLGTTESNYRGDPRKVSVLDQEKTYLLEVMKHYFPSRDEQVIQSFAGLRVLPKVEGAAFNSSRETRLIVDQKNKPKRLAIYGGKLTGYRATSEKVMKKIATSLGARKQNYDTAKIILKRLD